MSFSYLALSGVALLLFLPGALILHLYFSRRGRSFPLVDLLLSGSILWNFLFLVPSLFLGLFTNTTLVYFLAFTVLSVGAIAFYLFLGWRGALKGFHSLKRILSRVNLPQSLGALYLPLIWIFLALLTMYTPIVQNIDAVLYYLPMAKAIVQTGGMTYSPLYLSRIEMTFPLALPLMYSFLIDLTQGVNVRLVPIIYFVLTGLVVFKVSSRFSGKDGGLVAVIAYSSMLATQMLVVVEGLSLDLGYVFYSTVALYALMKGFEEKGRFWYIVAGMSCGLAALTKELGILTLLLSLSFLLLYSKLKGRRALFLVSSTFFFTGIQAFETFVSFGSPYISMASVPYLQRLFLIAVLLILLYYLSRGGSPDNQNSVGASHILPFLVLSIIPCLFYAWNFFSLGVFTPDFAPSLTKAIAGAGVPLVGPSIQIPDLSSPLAVPFIIHLDWYLLFLAIPVGLVYLVPGLAGLIDAVRRFTSRIDRDVQILLIWFVALLVMWSFLSSLLSWQASDVNDQYRRLYYFSPILSVMIGYGFMSLFRRLNLRGSPALYFITFNTLSLAYVWAFRQPLDAFILRTMFQPDLMDLVFFSSAFALTLLVPFLLERYGIELSGRSVKSFLHRSLPLIPAIVLVGNMLLPVGLIGLGASRIGGEGWDPTYYNQLGSAPPALGRGPWIEVIDYYNQHVQDSYCTVMFYAWTLPYFADRPVIDPYRTFSYEPLIPLLTIENRDALIQKLLDMNIRYFLIPKPDAPDIYALYEEFANKYLLFRIVTQDPSFKLIHEFTLYRMYKLEKP